MVHKWYVVRTFSGHENKVKTFLENEIKYQGLEEYIKQVLIPTEKVFEVKDGKKKSKSKSFFPGYVLVEAFLDKKVKDLILNTPSVMGFLGSRNNPQSIHLEEIKRIIGKISESEDTARIENPFRVGDQIKIIDGPFNNFSGTVQEVNNEKLKMKAMVSIFGRRTPVEIDFVQAELEK